MTFSFFQKSVAGFAILLFGLGSIVFTMAAPKGLSYWPFTAYMMYADDKKDISTFKEYTYFGIPRDGDLLHEVELINSEYLAPFDRDSFRKAVRSLRRRDENERIRLGIKHLLKKNTGTQFVAFKIYLDRWEFDSKSGFLRGLPSQRQLILEEPLD